MARLVLLHPGMSGSMPTDPTPLLLIEGVLVKLECVNPSGSVKDRVARFMLMAALHRGEVRPGDTVVETSSGNTGIALALAGRELGLKVIIFMPEHMTPERRRFIEGLGAEVRLTPRAEGFAGAVAQRDRFRRLPGFYVPDQFGNADNSRCHRETTGAEILEQSGALGFRRLTAFVAGIGTGGTLMGVGQALRARFPELRRIAVEPAESAIMSGGKDGEHGIQGIGDGFIPDLVDMGQVDEVITVSTDEAHREAMRLQSVHGYCVGRSAGANMLAARKVLRRDGGTVATLWPDSADRYRSVGLGAPAGAMGCGRRNLCDLRADGMKGLPRPD